MKAFFAALYFITCTSFVFPQSSYGEHSGFPMQLSEKNKFYPDFSGSYEPVVNVLSAKPKKSPALGIMLSTLIPGSGQIYAGSWLKGIILLGAETALWMGYFNNHRNGQKWEDFFQDYADTYWSRERWEQFYNPATDPSTHHLPLDANGIIIKTQQYYEMIGKYDQFVQGWPDWDPNNPSDTLTPMRDDYEGMRHKSNQAFIRATNLTMIVMVNHLISIFDAGFTIRRINRADAGIRMTMLTGSNSWTPAMALYMSF